MNPVNQDSNVELDLNTKLGQVALNRAGMYQSLAVASRYPTIELAEILINGTFYSKIKEYVQWVNRDNGMFDSQLFQLREIAQNKPDYGLEEMLMKMEQEYGRLCSITKYDRIQGLQNSKPLDIDNSYLQEAFVTSESEKMLNHISKELDYFHFLCKKEGEAWQSGKMPKAKQWRRKQRDFMVNHLGNRGESFFAGVRKVTLLEAYQVLASLGQAFMRLERGY